MTSSSRDGEHDERRARSHPALTPEHLELVRREARAVADELLRAEAARAVSWLPDQRDPEAAH